MKTRIIKLQSFKVNLKEIFEKLAAKIGNRNTEITMIIKDKNDINANAYSNDQSHQQSKKVIQNLKLSSQIKRMRQDSIVQLQRQQSSQINQRVQRQSNGSQSDSDSVSVDICISNHDILPNVSISGYRKLKTCQDGNKRRVSLDNLNLPVWPQAKLQTKTSRHNLTEQAIEQKSENLSARKANQIKQTQNNNLPPILQKKNQQKNWNIFDLKVEENNENKSSKSVNFKSEPEIANEKKNSQRFKSEYLSANFSDKSEDQESLAQSLFIIENKLNDAIKFIETNQVFELEEYLYEFKTKYANLSQRIQIKWRLLMAHCKQSRKQYQRASILYSQVLQLAEISPKSLLIDSADILHRLGICYTQIRQWNMGIMAFVKALNELKGKGKTIKYAQCMNNLGTLYLYAGKITEAQKCFLVSYDLKKKQYDPNSKNLISSLLNIFQCNISAHNYDQAEQILKIAETIFSQTKQNQMVMGGLLRRKGKLLFLKGDLEGAKNLYLTAFEKLSTKYPYCLQYGQLMNNIGILNIEENQVFSAKNYFERSLIILNFYYTRDSIYVQMIKKNLQLANNLIKKANSSLNSVEKDEIIQMEK